MLLLNHLVQIEEGVEHVGKLLDLEGAEVLAVGEGRAEVAVRA